MSSRPILFDTTRLLTRLKHPSPSGIDRVDLAYARHVLRGQPDRRALGVTVRGPRLLPPDRAARLLALVGERWRETIAAADDPVLARLRRILGGPGRERPEPGPEPRTGGRAARSRLDLEAAGYAAGAHLWPGARTAPRDAIYLHTSHLRLDRPQHFAWLHDRPDIRPVFFVHDLIPIEYPEYGVPGEDRRHAVRMETVSRHAALVVANSRDVAARFDAYAHARGLRRPPVAVAPLGVEDAFLRRPTGLAAGRPYLVVCSTIEARKNHLILLQAWRAMAAEGGDVPALVIVGRRGWESEAATDLLDRCPSIRPHVVEAPGLSTPALAELVAGARALLMPSFAEGYGIPIVEALTLGTPVVASDIPVHREVAGDHARYVDPLDGPGWIAAIREAAATARRAPPGYEPPTWEAHFAVVDDLLGRL